MAVCEIKPKVYAVGVNDWDRRLFDELIPLPDGTSYNSYFIQGSEKTALIDSADPATCDEYFTNLNEIKIDRVDYIISNHAEQDHSGSLPKLLKKYPTAKIVTNQKCKDFLKDLLLLSDDTFLVQEDRSILSLGDKTLEFVLSPWVHWPETMMTYLKEDNILFSCDLFGAHLATSDLFAIDEKKVYESAKRYYAEIMMPFRTNIQKHMEKISSLDIDFIAPSHGPVYNKPSLILDAYKEWISDDVINQVIIPYVSMHESTKKMVTYLTDLLTENGLDVKPYNLTEIDIGQLAKSLVDAATVVIATPTVLAGPHPSAVYAAYLINILRPKTKFITVIGSYGWGGRTLDIIKNTLTNVKAEFLKDILIKGYPKQQDFNLLKELADEIKQKHQSIKLLK